MSNKNLALAAVLLVICAVIVWLLRLALAVPQEWLEPDAVSADELAERARAVEDFVEEAKRRINDGEAFGGTLSQSALNSFFILRTGEYDLPEELSTLRLEFKPGVVVLRTKVNGHGLAAVATLCITVSLDDEGKVTLKPVAAKIGRLPVPGAAARWALNRLVKGTRLEGAFSGVTIDPADLSILPIRLDTLQIEEGLVRIKGHVD